MKTLLLILDGLGASPVKEGNAALLAKMPYLDKLIANYPHTLLAASGMEVGLIWGDAGNSEVGHLNIGSGRIIEQDMPRICQSIQDGSFFKNPNILETVRYLKQSSGKLHLIGLLSDGNVHASLVHLDALIEFAKQNTLEQVYLHLFTDGRDSPPKSAQTYFSNLLPKLKDTNVRIATICGRYFAMDRDKNWDRTQKAYETIFNGQGKKIQDVLNAIQESYQSNKTDEFIEPLILDNPGIKSGDAIIFFNYRADRAKQLTEAIVNPYFKGFKRDFVEKVLFVGFINYGFEPTPMVKIAFFVPDIKNTVAEVFSLSSRHQFHLAETEKFAHVTYFFNGGREQAFTGEDRKLVPSPKVATYDLKPEMSAGEVTEELIKAIESEKYDFIVTNYANPDMVGHTGNLQAGIVACETIDRCLEKVIPAALEKKYQIIVTADHGNIEQMINPQTGQPDTEHSTNPVPIIFVSDKVQKSQENREMFFSRGAVGVLADVTTSVLARLELQKPPEMNGVDILEHI